MTAQPVAAAIAGSEHDEPTIEADLGPSAFDLRAPERAELLSAVARVLATGEPAPGDARRRDVFGVAAGTRRNAGWSDVVQCRRWSGTHLLHYATAPPTRA